MRTAYGRVRWRSRTPEIHWRGAELTGMLDDMSATTMRPNIGCEKRSSHSLKRPFGLPEPLTSAAGGH
ncbi:hypothetical protein GCM10027579_19020 [Calidifontibacter terrae]